MFHVRLARVLLVSIELGVARPDGAKHFVNPTRSDLAEYCLPKRGKDVSPFAEGDSLLPIVCAHSEKRGTVM